MTGVAALLLFTGLGLKLSLLTVTLAEITFSIAYVTVIVRGRLGSISPEVEEAARDLGCTPWQALRLVTLPALFPALLGSGLLVFALVFDDFVLAFFTTGVDPQPLPVRIYSSIRFGISPAINAVGTLMLLVSGAADRGRAAAAAPVQPQDVQPGPDHRRRTPMTESPTADAGPAVSLRGLTKQFGGTTVVDHVDLDVASGEFFSLLGPSGCGKTTTLRMIAGFNDPTSGTVQVGGDDVTSTPPHKRDVNTVFQSYALFEHLDVRGNVGFGLRRKGSTAPASTSASARCSSWWSSARAPRTGPPSSPAASGSASPWPGR